MTWRAWEYRVLAENLPAEKTARLLGRSVEEVRRKADRECTSTLDAWYQRNRCPGSPRSPQQLLRLARKVSREDFPRVFEQDEVVNITVRVLRYCFQSFDETVGNPRVTVQRRFLSRFRFWLRRQLAQEADRKRRRLRKLPRLRLPVLSGEVRAPADDEDDVEGQYAVWSCQLFRAALRRLDPKAGEVIRLRLGGAKDKDIARQLGLSAKTLSNRLSKNKVIRLVQEAVRGLVRGLPADHLRALVGHLLNEAGLAEGQVVRLLCLSAAELAEAFRAVRAGAGAGLEREEALRLLYGPATLERAA